MVFLIKISIVSPIGMCMLGFIWRGKITDSPWLINFPVSKISFIISSHLFQLNVRVMTMDAELEFAIQPSTTGKQLFDQVRHIIYH